MQIFALPPFRIALSTIDDANNGPVVNKGRSAFIKALRDGVNYGISLAERQKEIFGRRNPN